MPEMPASVRRPIELKCANELKSVEQRRMRLNAMHIGRLRTIAARCVYDMSRFDFVGGRRMRQGENPCELLK